MDRYNVDPLIVKKDTVRDGDALAQQASDGQFAIFMYLVAVASLSAFLWMLVMYRKMKYGDDEFEADQTEVVAEEMEQKEVPELKVQPLYHRNQLKFLHRFLNQRLNHASTIRQRSTRIAPLPPTGLPEGWTQEQWNHFGWQYIEGFSKKK